MNIEKKPVAILQARRVNAGTEVQNFKLYHGTNTLGRDATLVTTCMEWPFIAPHHITIQCSEKGFAFVKDHQEMNQSRLEGIPLVHNMFYEFQPGRTLVLAGLLRCTLLLPRNPDDEEATQLVPVHEFPQSDDSVISDDSYQPTLPYLDLTQSIDNGHRFLKNPDQTIDPNISMDSKPAEVTRPPGRILPAEFTQPFSSQRRLLPVQHPMSPPTAAPRPSASKFRQSDPFQASDSYEATQIMGGGNDNGNIVAGSSNEYDPTQAFDANLEEASQVIEQTQPMPVLETSPQESQELVKATQETEEDAAAADAYQATIKIASTQEDLLLTPTPAAAAAVRQSFYLRVPSTPIQQESELSGSQTDVIPQTQEVIPATAPSSLEKSSQPSDLPEEAAPEDRLAQEEEALLESAEDHAASTSSKLADPNSTMVAKAGDHKNDHAVTTGVVVDEFERDLSLPPTEAGDSPENEQPSQLQTLGSSQPSLTSDKPVLTSERDLIKELGFSSPVTRSQDEGDTQRQSQEHADEPLELSASPTIAADGSQDVISKLPLPNSSFSGIKMPSSGNRSFLRRPMSSSTSTASSTSEGGRGGQQSQEASEYHPSDQENSSPDGHEDSHHDNNDDDDDDEDIKDGKKKGKNKGKGRKGGSPKRPLEPSSDSEGGREGGAKSRSRLTRRQASNASISSSSQKGTSQPPQSQQQTQSSQQQRSLQRTGSAASIGSTAVRDLPRTRSRTLDRDSSFVSSSSQMSVGRGPSTVSDAGSAFFDWTKPKVMFSGDAGKIPVNKERVYQLGGTIVVTDLLKASVVVMEECKRVAKLYRSVLYGIPVLNTQWLRDCHDAKKFIEPEVKHYATDTSLEEAHGFKLHESIRLSRERAFRGEPGFFSGLTFRFLAPEGCYNIKDYKELIEGVDGKCDEKTDPTFDDPKESTVILGPNLAEGKEYQQCLRFARKGYHVVTKDFVLMAILKQRIDLPHDYETFSIKHITSAPKPKEKASRIPLSRSRSSK